MSDENKFPGIGARIAQRLNSMGYWKNGKPDISRFCREKQYDKVNFYPWVNANRVPGYGNLRRLAQDLNVPICWLLLGDEGIKDLREHERQAGGTVNKRERRRLNFG